MSGAVRPGGGPVAGHCWVMLKTAPRSAMGKVSDFLCVEATVAAAHGWGTDRDTGPVFNGVAMRRISKSEMVDCRFFFSKSGELRVRSSLLRGLPHPYHVKPEDLDPLPKPPDPALPLLLINWDGKTAVTPDGTRIKIVSTGAALATDHTQTKSGPHEAYLVESGVGMIPRWAYRAQDSSRPQDTKGETTMRV